MRILRGLSGRVLSCGCLIGIYETYEGQTVGILDAQNVSCADPAHMPETIFPLENNVPIELCCHQSANSPPGGDN